MKEQENGIINMSGQEMKVFVSASCVTDLNPDKAFQLPKVIGSLCKTLHMRNVAKYLLLKIRINDTVVLVDKNSGYTYRLRIGTDEIHVIGIYDHRNQPDCAPERTLLLVNTRLLELIRGSRRMAVAA